MNFWEAVWIKVTSAVTSVMIFLGLTAAPATTLPEITNPEIPEATTQVVLTFPKTEIIKAPTTEPKVVEIPLTPPDEPAQEPEQAQEPSTPAPAPQPPVTVYVPIYIPAPTMPQPTAGTAQTEEPMPQPENLPTPPQPQKYTIEVISPINGKGLGREYLARDPMLDEFNYVELGLVVRDSAGKDVRDVKVEVTATDTEQNKTLESTGNQTTIYVNGAKKVVYYYPFHYEFKTPGDHSVEFKVDIKTARADFPGVPSDERPMPQ